MERIELKMVTKQKSLNDRKKTVNLNKGLWCCYVRLVHVLNKNAEESEVKDTFTLANVCV